MTAQNLNEVFNFVNKFLDLSRTGKNANLSLQCQDGRVVLNLQLQLPTYPPPQYHPRQPSHPYPRASPSRVRRSLRRADARAKKAENDALKIPQNLTQLSKLPLNPSLLYVQLKQSIKLNKLLKVRPKLVINSQLDKLDKLPKL